MKAINLHNFSNPDPASVLNEAKLYSVYLCNGRKVRLSDRKKMLKFMAGASKELTGAMIEIIEVTKAVFPLAADGFIYVEMWSGKEIEIFGEIFSKLNKASNYSGPNAHPFIFKELYDCIKMISSMLGLMNEFYREKNHFLQVKQIDIMLNRIYAIKHKVDHIGRN